ncbi:hypothetical protein MUP05_08560, partial [Candidatus Bathyarchaeota archaeon]|nr:hypothetical protein [Candidatus Bathyarchaeota archaeon]
MPSRSEVGEGNTSEQVQTDALGEASGVGAVARPQGLACKAGKAHAQRWLSLECVMPTMVVEHGLAHEVVVAMMSRALNTGKPWTTMSTYNPNRDRSPNTQPDRHEARASFLQNYLLHVNLVKWIDERILCGKPCLMADNAFASRAMKQRST